MIMTLELCIKTYFHFIPLLSSYFQDYFHMIFSIIFCFSSCILFPVYVQGFLGPSGMSIDVSLRDINVGMPLTRERMYALEEQALYLIKVGG